jgi:uncharacterized OB-fold protein
MTDGHAEADWTVVNGPTLTADDASAAFFAAAGNDQLVVKKCPSCRAWAAPSTDSCPDCHSDHLEWHRASGKGELVTWTVIHNAPHPAFADDMPIVSAIVQLVEGPWLNLRLLGSRSGLRVGAKIDIGFAHPADGASYPVGILPREGTHD